MGKNRNINKEENKKLDILGMWKNFWNPEAQEKSKEEEILQSNKISEDDKKELLESLDEMDKLSNKLFRDSYKVTILKRKNLKEDAKISLNMQKLNEEELSKYNNRDDEQNEMVK